MEIFDLVKAMQSGNRDAYIEMYAKYSAPIYFLCKKLTLDDSQAGIALEGTFSAVYKNIAKLTNPEGFDKWLYAIAVTRCRAIAKRFDPEAFSMRTTETAESVPQDGIDEDVFPEDDERSLALFNSAVDTLPDDQRLSVLMYYFCEMNENEISRFFSCEPGQVIKTINDARDALGAASDKACEDGFIPFGTGILPVISDVFLISASHCSAPLECQEKVLANIEAAIKAQNSSAERVAAAPRIQYANSAAVEKRVPKKGEITKSSPIFIWAVVTAAIALVAGIVILVSLIHAYQEENGHRNLGQTDGYETESGTEDKEANAGTESASESESETETEYKPSVTEEDETANFEKDTDETETYICAHEFSDDGIPVDPTCTEKGYTEYTCSKCGDNVKAEFVNALGHSYGNWILNEEDNTRSKICELCEDTVTEKIEETETESDTEEEESESETETETEAESESETEEEPIPEVSAGLSFKTLGNG
ncbi:MAG: sigma-70 family RNA polymerase sigma factor, partial [Ruminococcaceae bacterium]|nr:sigma-70 family RNA polymerase sigma factor [Oscillospiraceae bacterium]